MSEGRLTGSFDPAETDERAVAAAAVPRASVERTPGSGARTGLGRLPIVREAGLVVFILALAGMMTALKPAEFANPRNLIDILANAAMPAIVAQGAILIICAGGIDISVGSMMGLAAAAAALAAKSGVSPPVCLVLAMAIGCGLSLLNASVALLARIHPIIVTLAGISIYRGLLVNAMGGKVIEELPHAYRMLADGNLLGVPKVCYYVLVITFLAHVLLRHTVTGRQVLALGDSETAARLIGLSKTRLTLFVFAVSGALVGLTAVLDGAYYGNIQANTGEGMEFKAIAAAVIGGTNIMGGRGSAIGGLLGAFLVAMVYNALVLLAVSSFWQNLFVGTLILLAVIADALVRRRGGASA
jgi:ribose/xylose/arabinose/galactoside ABC-type transport system permease subunit